MSSAIYNFTIEQGATFRRVFILKDENGDPIDLSTATAVLKARKNKASSAIIDLSVGNGITMGATDGKITVELTDAQTGALTELDMVYDMKVDFGADKCRIIQGNIKLDTEVSY